MDDCNQIKVSFTYNNIQRSWTIDDLKKNTEAIITNKQNQADIKTTKAAATVFLKLQLNEKNPLLNNISSTCWQRFIISICDIFSNFSYFAISYLEKINTIFLSKVKSAKPEINRANPIPQTKIIPNKDISDDKNTPRTFGRQRHNTKKATKVFNQKLVKTKSYDKKFDQALIKELFQNCHSLHGEGNFQKKMRIENEIFPKKTPQEKFDLLNTIREKIKGQIAIDYIKGLEGLENIIKDELDEIIDLLVLTEPKFRDNAIKAFDSIFNENNNQPITLKMVKDKIEILKTEENDKLTNIFKDIKAAKINKRKEAPRNEDQFTPLENF